MTDLTYLTGGPGRRNVPARLETTAPAAAGQGG